MSNRTIETGSQYLRIVHEDNQVHTWKRDTNETLAQWYWRSFQLISEDLGFLSCLPDQPPRDASTQASCDTCLDMGIPCQCVDEPLEPTGAKAMTDQWDEKHGPTLEQIADFKAQYPQHAKAMGL